VRAHFAGAQRSAIEPSTPNPPRPADCSSHTDCLLGEDFIPFHARSISHSAGTDIHTRPKQQRGAVNLWSRATTSCTWIRNIRETVTARCVDIGGHRQIEPEELATRITDRVCRYNYAPILTRPAVSYCQYEQVADTTNLWVGVRCIVLVEIYRSCLSQSSMKCGSGVGGILKILRS
jgi:hypothetical protein